MAAPGAGRRAGLTTAQELCLSGLVGLSGKVRLPRSRLPPATAIRGASGGPNGPRPSGTSCCHGRLKPPPRTRGSLRRNAWQRRNSPSLSDKNIRSIELSRVADGTGWPKSEGTPGISSFIFSNRNGHQTGYCQEYHSPGMIF